MIERLSAAGLKLPLLFSALIVIGCTRGDHIAGGSGSTTTNGFTAAIRNGRGEAVAGAVVRVRPNDYCATGTLPGISSTERSVLDTVTGSDGLVSVGGLLPGRYAIEINDAAAGEGALIRSEITAGPQVDFGVRTVKPVGAIGGMVDPMLLAAGAAFGVQVYGLERYAPVDPRTGRFLVTSLPPDTYTVRLIAEDTAFTPVDYDSIRLSPGDTVAVDPFAGWAHQGELTVDIAASGISIDDTIRNFPLLLQLDRDNFDFTTAKKKGGDLRVTKSDGSAVPINTDWWDSANATAVIWLLIDTLYGNRARQTLNVYWGNGRASTVSQPSAVFDTAFGYRGVWHLNESGGTMQLDATINARDGVPRGMDGANDVPGLIGRSQEFEGDPQCVVVGDASTNGSGAAEDEGFTVSAWVKAAKAAAGRWSVVAGSPFGILLDGSGRWVFYGAEAGYDADSAFAPASIGQWTQLTGVRRGSWNYLYVNGAIADSCPAGGSPSAADLSGDSLFIGALPGGSGWFEGIIDEMRIHRGALSQKWIRLCYETQREGRRVVSLERVR
ncbi:MAG: DUF2341 domain-containing protein [Chitinispirillaceae bacterium]|nr:DUF2341 domain-containing protein [Chitinispirillaceae bacterium]